MTGKPGRKTLFTGPVMNGAPDTAPAGEVPVEIEDALARAIEGDYSVKIDLSGLDGIFRPLAGAINVLLEKTAGRDAAVQARLNDMAQAQKQSEAIIQQNPMPMIVADPQLGITGVNEAYLKMSGISKDRALSMSLRDFKIRSQKGEGLKQAIQDKKRSFGEVTVELPSGVHILEQYGIPLLNEKKEISSILIVYNDITEEKEQADEAHRMQVRVDRMIKDNPLAIAVLRKDKSRTDINKEYEKMWRGSYEELMRKKLYDFDIKVLSGDDFYACFETKKRSMTETLVSWPDGVKKYLTLHAIPILDEKGEIDSAFYVWVDFTEQHTKMEEIVELQRRAETIIQENPMPMIVANPQLKITVANEAYLKMSGISKDRILSMSLRDFKIRAQKGEGLKQVMQDRKRSFGEVVVELPSGVHILEQYGIPLLNEKKEISSILIVYNDVTEEREHLHEIEIARKRSESMVKENPLAIAILDKTKKRIDINTMYEKTWRGTRQELMAKKLYDFDIKILSGDDFYACFEKRKLSVTEMLVSWPDGVKKYLVLYAIPIFDETGEIDIAFYVYLDMTEQREKEIQVRQLMETTQAEAARLGESAAELGKALAGMAQGDLRAFVAIGENDPLAKVKADYNASVTSIRALVQEIMKSVMQVEGTSNETSKSSDEIIRATEQVALSTQHSSEDARKQLEKIEEIGKEITDLSASIEEIASTTQEVMEHAAKAAKEGQDAAVLGQEATKKMQVVESISLQSVQEISDLNNQMREINNIVKLITDIANQTNLLALNAAIEAARAGEHGRGFAVVAGEIRNLAGESKSASQNIENLIRAIQTTSDKTAGSMKSSHTEIQSGISSVNKAIEALNRIITEAEVVAHGISEITKASEDQANSTNRVMQKMEDSTHMTKENMSRTEDLAALAEEVSASTQEVGSASHELAEMAAQLKKKMEQFKVA
jgi:methyl-accepting chemotaxis protein